MAFPISQRAAVDPDESTAEAIADWHYRVARPRLQIVLSFLPSKQTITLTLRREGS
jgi:hypothetical protein